MDDNDDEESQKFLTNGMMKKKKYEEYHEEYVRIFISPSAVVVTELHHLPSLVAVVIRLSPHRKIQIQ